MQRIRSGAREYETLDTLHRENLELVLRENGLDAGDFTEDDLHALALSWRYLPPWADSVNGISELKRDFIVGPLSNGNTALLVEMAKFADLPWDVVLGSDVSRAYKPDPVAYRTPARLLELDIGEVMLVAAHNGDLAARATRRPGHRICRSPARARTRPNIRSGTNWRLGRFRFVDHGSGSADLSSSHLTPSTGAVRGRIA